MSDNCDICGKFMTEMFGKHEQRINTNFCNKCTEVLDCEQIEAELGIGNGQICYTDEYYCRHCVERK